MSARLAFGLREIADQDTVNAEIGDSIEELNVGEDNNVDTEFVDTQRPRGQTEGNDAGGDLHQPPAQPHSRRVCQATATRRTRNTRHRRPVWTSLKRRASGIWPRLRRVLFPLTHFCHP